MDRPSGPPLGTATQSTGRPMLESSSAARPAASNGNRRYPQHGRLGSSSVPLSAGQVVTLAREAMKNAIEENKSQVAETSGVSADLKPGVTIDLSRNSIQRFPDEVVDIIKDELVRLALSHNQLATLPPRFAECSLLRYLNIRNNVMREIPQCICQLVSLEILDLGRNKLRVLPPELSNLTNLKVLSVQRNRIEELPLCLVDMNSLQVLKFDDNPIRFPPPEVLQAPQVVSPPGAIPGRENEAIEVTVTAQIKRFLKQKLTPQTPEPESAGEESSEGTETPKPIKRVASGRFPIKVNGTDVPDLRSPALPRPPPIPTRSHYRGLSQQSISGRRSGVVPLAIANSNERLRSNSESVSRERERQGDMRRISLLNRNMSDLGTVDESKANRFSFHSRGLSHGSAMQGNSALNPRGTDMPIDTASQRTPPIFRLSSIPERKRITDFRDPIIEGAKGILFALFQIHPLIQSLVGLAKTNEDKRSSLEAVFYNASFHVEELDRTIQGFEQGFELEEKDIPRSNENVYSACLTCVSAYVHVCALLSKQTESLINNTDPRYIRSLLLSLYGSLMEVRNASSSLVQQDQGQTAPTIPSLADTIRPQLMDRQATPTRDRPSVSGRRSRSGTVIRDTNLRVATNVPAPPFINGLGRPMISAVSATPRSGESFGSAGSRGITNGDFTEEDRIFDNIFLHLQQSCDLALKTLPGVNTQILLTMKNYYPQGSKDPSRQIWQGLSQKCGSALSNAEALKARLSLIKLKEPGIRTQTAFWELCNAFINAYTDLALKIREAKLVLKNLPLEVIELLRPLQKIISKTSKLIQTSPWSIIPGGQPGPGPANGMYNGLPSIGQTMMPMTPASAALGPAVQATVPSTPQTASYSSNMFSGNVFERADALLSMNSAFSSRAGTMTSSLAPNMASNDGSMTPSSIISPVASMTNLARFNNSRAVF